jgi:hypothetical protein
MQAVAVVAHGMGQVVLVVVAVLEPVEMLHQKHLVDQAHPIPEAVVAGQQIKVV